ncbi:MAG: hypothetical protein DHS20C17_28520 [Cyclobacteriaceae bacterium]|nr:MAG: hypothetical protein DHS20C17_28520 [Cyclobacteriaceae bacterium]
MKIYLNKFILVIAFLNCTALEAQQVPEPQKLKQFSFMIGEWQGNGTYYSSQGESEIEVHESVVFAADSTILLIHGKGRDSDGKIHHDAIGVIYTENGQTHVHAFTMQGQNVIADVNKNGEKSFDWGFDLPNGGKIKYSATFTETTWEESGTYTTPDGNQSFPTVKMSLKKSGR